MNQSDNQSHIYLPICISYTWRATGKPIKLHSTKGAVSNVVRQGSIDVANS